MSLIPWKGKRQDGEPENMGLTAPLGYFRSEMDRLFDRFFEHPMGLSTPWFGSSGTWMPSLDVSETEAEVTVRAEVPGVDPKELDVTVSGQVLTLSGEKKETVEKKGENFYRSERRFGSFRRSVQLPAAVDMEKMTAEHHNGVLMIRLKKQQSAQPKRITVQSAKE